MSYNMSFKIRLIPAPIDGVEILRSLLSAGWTADNTCGHIDYSLEEPDGDNDALTVPLEELDELLMRFDSHEKNGMFYGISLFWDGTDQGIVIFQYPRDKDRVLNFGYRLTRVVCDFAPPLTDHNWYLKRILPALQRGGAVVRKLEWIESP